MDYYQATLEIGKRRLGVNFIVDGAAMVRDILGDPDPELTRMLQDAPDSARYFVSMNALRQTLYSDRPVRDRIRMANRVLLVPVLGAREDAVLRAALLKALPEDPLLQRVIGFMSDYTLRGAAIAADINVESLLDDSNASTVQRLKDVLDRARDGDFSALRSTDAVTLLGNDSAFTGRALPSFYYGNADGRNLVVFPDLYGKPAVFATKQDVVWRLLAAPISAVLTCPECREKWYWSSADRSFCGGYDDTSDLGDLALVDLQADPAEESAIIEEQRNGSPYLLVDSKYKVVYCPECGGTAQELEFSTQEVDCE